MQLLLKSGSEYSLDQKGIVLQVIGQLQQEYIDKVRDIFMEDEVKIVKNYSNIVSIFTNQDEHLNVTLIEEGWLKADLSKIMDETQR